ncbi:MAG: hypothetical protein QOG84_791 [Sphingomonadales bacterium]|jgi:hypothetical protein|nr:hypothetical protein [Sphingomonadales bacterium]
MTRTSVAKMDCFDAFAPRNDVSTVIASEAKQSSRKA